MMLDIGKNKENNTIKIIKEGETNKNPVVFRLKRKADETPLENLLLENYGKQYEQMIQNNKQREEQEKEEEQKQQEQQEQQEQSSQIENRKKIKQNQIDELNGLFDKTMSISQQVNGQEKPFILRRIQNFLNQTNQVQKFQENLQEESRQQNRNEQLNKKRNLERNKVDSQITENITKGCQKFVDIQFSKEKKTLTVIDKQNKKEQEICWKDKQEKLLLQEQNSNKKENENQQEEDVEDFYILEQAENQGIKEQIGENLWLMDGEQYYSVNVGKDMEPYVYQDQFGQQIVIEEPKHSDPDYCDSDSNRSSNPNNTYPSSEESSEQDENEDKDIQSISDEDGYSADCNDDDDPHYNDNEEMDEETYYMKKQNIKLAYQQKPKRKQKNKQYSNSSNSEDQVDLEEFEEEFQQFMQKQMRLKQNQQNSSNFDYSQDF